MNRYHQKLFGILLGCALAFWSCSKSSTDESTDLSGSTGMVVAVSGQPSDGDPTVTITTTASGESQVAIESTPGSTTALEWEDDFTTADTNEDEELVLSVTATYGISDQTTISYSILASESTCDDGAWSTPLSIGSSDGNFAGVPSNDDVGSCFIKVQAAAEGKTITMEFTLTINNVNDAPTWTTEVDDFSLEEETAISGKLVAASDIDAGDSITYSIDDAVSNCDDGDWTVAPAVASDGTLSGTPSTSDLGTCTFAVKADDGEAEITTSFSVVVYHFDPNAPAEPTNVTNAAFSATSGQSPEITWTQSTDHNAGDATVFDHYVAYLGTAAGNSDVATGADVEIADPTSYTFTGVGFTNCNTYHVTVKAWDDNSPAAALASIPALSDTSFIFDIVAPTKVATITPTLDATTSSSATTSWAGSFSDCPSATLTYEIAVSKDTATEGDIIAGGGWKSVGTATSGNFASGVSIDVTSPATSYYTLVRATDAYGNVSTVYGSDPWYISIMAIDNLGLAGRSTTTIDLGWTKPDENGIVIGDFEIQYKEDGGSWATYVDGVSIDEATTISGLTDDTIYFFRVRSIWDLASTPQYSDWSNVLEAETLIDIEFFEPGTNQAMNLGGATESWVVAFEDDTDFWLNSATPGVGSPDFTIALAGERYKLTTGIVGDHLQADKPFFVAGRIGVGTNQNSGNIVWNHPNWAGKEFLLNGSRNGPHKVSIYAFEAAEVTINKGGVFAASHTFAIDETYTFTLNDNASYEMHSDGYVMGYMYSNASGLYYDPMPLLPISADIIGYPSSKGQFSSSSLNNAYNGWHSSGSTISGTFNAGTTTQLNPVGTSSLYNGDSLRIISTDTIVGRSNADSNGYCSSPFLPVTMMRKRYAINVLSDYVAFASTDPVRIRVYPGDGSASFDIDLTGGGADEKTPYKYRLTNQTAGTRYEAIAPNDNRFAAWYHPNDSMDGAADLDETILFGVD